MYSDLKNKSINVFNDQYKGKGMSSQRMYPNESLIQFIASNYFKLDFDKRKKIKILEVGSGSGANLWMLAKEGFDVYGLDSSNKGNQLAKTHLNDKWGVNASLTVGDFTDLPYEDNFFDAVIDVVSLQHINLNDCTKAFNQVVRVLKPSGKFFSYRLSDHSVMYKNGGGEMLDSSTIDNIADANMPLANNGPIAFWSPAICEQMYNKSGFQIDSIEKIARTHANGMLVEYLSICSHKR